MNTLSAIRKTVTWAHIVLYALLLANGVVFRHSHKLNGGRIISHAHPYERSNDSPFQNHHHSEGELWLLDLVSNGIYVGGECVTAKADGFIGYPVTPSEKRPEVYYHTFFTSAVSLRGPPVSITHLF